VSTSTPPTSESQIVPVRPPGIAADSIVRVFRVPPEFAGTRIDVFLRASLRSTSRTRARLIARAGAYDVLGRKLKPSDRLQAEGRLVLWRSPLVEDDTSAPILTLYEDDHLLVIDKPPLVTVHPTARYHSSTILERLKAERPGEYLSLVHRLDRDTSGVLLVARSARADSAFKRMLEDRTTKAHCATVIRKIYYAITQGVPESGTISSPLEPDDTNSLRVKMRLARPGCGLEARTTVRVIDARSGFALVACELHTGRQHQIRVHLAAVGCPVVGDKLYGPEDRLLARAADGELSDDDRMTLLLPRHALHAAEYCLTHALTHAPLQLRAPLAPDLRAFWARLADGPLTPQSSLQLWAHPGVAPPGWPLAQGPF
jgi:23S rRNA pseudouridine1911/1915/1917 synthase